MSNETTWLTRAQAASWLHCSADTVSTLCREMDEYGLDGVMRLEGGKLFRVNQKALSNYLFKRKTLKRGRET